MAVEEETSDHVTLRVTVDAPTILLMTDPYSDGWSIRAMTEASKAWRSASVLSWGEIEVTGI